MQKITMEHKEQIEKLREKYGHELSSHTFSSLYLWQRHMGLTLELREDLFAVKCGNRGENTWFFPCGDKESAYHFISERICMRDFSLCYLRQEDVLWLRERFPGRWTVKREPESDEYIGNISEYLAMEGGRFSEIRRKIRKLHSVHRVEVQKIDRNDLADAKAVFHGWQSVSHCMGKGELTDDGIAELALKNRMELDINGIVFYLDGTAAAVFAGFPINRDTLDVLIGKCMPGTPNGTVYGALYEYLKAFGTGYIWCNHEEDLGIEGIRQMKNSLCPARKNEIWRAFLNE